MDDMTRRRGGLSLVGGMPIIKEGLVLSIEIIPRKLYRQRGPIGGYVGRGADPTDFE